MLVNKNLFNISQKAVIGSLLFIIIGGGFLFFGNSVSATEADRFGMNFAAGIGLPDKDPRIAAVEIIRIALGFLGIIAVIIIMYGGFIWMTSSGNVDKVERAKKILTNAIIGLVIILSAFLIVSFVLNKLKENSAGGGGIGVMSRRGGGGGIGAIGNCVVEIVYPSPFQRNVPRNISIVVTFKEEADPLSIHDAANNIQTGSVKIFKSNDDPSVPVNLVANVRVDTTDNKTFIFTPAAYLGSQTEYIWYSVLLTNNIRSRETGRGIFDKCGINKSFEWKFEVSNKADLTPPQVVKDRVFPLPDNERDIVRGSPAIAAVGTVTVNALPFVYLAAALNGSVNSDPGSPPAVVSVDPNCTQSGSLTVTVLADGRTAELRRGTVLLGSAVFNGETAAFANLFSITVAGGAQAGNSWNFSVKAKQPSDTLTVNNIVYTFVGANPAANQIAVGADTSAAANNIRSALNSHPDVNATVSGNVVTVRAKVAGVAGNGIRLLAAADARLAATSMAGGSDAGQEVQIMDNKDQPRNSTIQINFNESMNPLTLSGSAADLADYIKVINAAAGARANGQNCAQDSDCLSYKCNSICQGDNLAGKFMISNQYRTVEFISDVVCGINGCGENIYCLPENSRLQVQIMAAPLATCTNAGECAAKAPFAACTGGRCYNPALNRNYPLSSSPLNGAADMSLNSLDGDRDENAEGPVLFYDENSESGNGDNYQWSFFISDRLDLTPPRITATEPVHSVSNVSLSNSVRINFSKLMMSDSLRTGSRIIDNGRDKIAHKMFNLWNFTDSRVGYWITKNDLDLPPNLDGVVDVTQVEINHSMFADTTSYRSQAGSGIKDIYQNCFSPSAGTSGVTCPANDTNRSCCPEGANIAPRNVGAGENCPEP